MQRYGATHTIPYTSPRCASSIRALTGNALRHALDCISDAESTPICYAALGRTGGTYASLEKCDAELLRARRAVRSEFVMGYEMFGRPIALPHGYGREASRDKYQQAVEWAAEVQGLVKRGEVRSHPVRVLEGGLEAVVPGLERLRRGEVRGEKLVVCLT